MIRTKKVRESFISRRNEQIAKANRKMKNEMPRSINQNLRRLQHENSCMIIERREEKTRAKLKLQEGKSGKQ